MEILSKRPFLTSLTVFLICSIVGVSLSVDTKYICIATASISFAITLTVGIIFVCNNKHGARSLFYSSICIAFCIVAFSISINFFNNRLAEIENLGEQNKVVARIENCSYRATYTATYTATIKSINGEETDFKAELSTNNAVDIPNGEYICANMTFAPFEENIYGFAERNTKISNGILVSATFDKLLSMPEIENKSDINSFFNNIRSAVAKRIDSSDFDNTSSLIKALLIGYDDELEAPIPLNFRRLGISHFLSISGSHFVILLGITALILSFFGINKRIIYAILIPLSLFYMGLCGFSFPVCRAGIMAAFTYSSFLLGREKDAYTSLFAATALIIVIFPYSVISVGMWLSFSATFAILILNDLLSGSKIFNKSLAWYLKLPLGMLAGLLITFAVSFFTLPIVSACFGEISIVTPIANLLIVPFLELYLYLLPFAVIFSWFKPLVKITELFGSGILYVIDKICETDNLLVSVRQHFVLPIAIIGVAATLILLTVKLPNKLIIFIPFIACTALIASGITVFLHLNEDKTQISYYTVGINDGVVLSDNNRTMCIDISNGGSAPVRYAEYIADTKYCPEIGAYLFTHYHTLHTGQLNRLSGRTKVQSIYLPKPIFENDYAIYENLISLAKEKNIKITEYEYGIPFDFENCKITVFAPQILTRSTHESISFKISKDLTDILYLGSSFSETALDYKDEAENADYIIFGQHHPISKEEFNISSNGNFIFGSEAVFAMTNIKTSEYVLSDGEQYDILLK